jgi:hypothetical protein
MPEIDFLMYQSVTYLIRHIKSWPFKIEVISISKREEMNVE